MTETVQVASFRTRLEAELAARLLDGLDIPYVINSAEGMEHGPLGPGATIQVRAEHADLAREALAAEREGERPHAVRLGPAVSERSANAMVEALRRAGIQALARTASGRGRTARDVTVFVRRDQASEARRVLDHIRRKER